MERENIFKLTIGNDCLHEFIPSEIRRNAIAVEGS
jgi:hypothetical protein